MSWLQTIKTLFGPSQSVSDPNHWILRMIGGGKTNSGVSMNHFSALNLPVVYSAISLISASMAQLPLHVIRREGRRRIMIHDHPIRRMFQRGPNLKMTPYAFANTIQSHTLAWGNGYAEIRRDQLDQPVGLEVLLPDRTAPDLRRDGSLWYRTTIDGQSQELPSEDVLHIPGMGFDGLLGYSPITLHREGLGLAQAAETFGGKFFGNDARSGGVLMHPGQLSPNAKKNIKTSFQEESGLDHAHEVKVLEEGMKFVTTTIPPDDAQFILTREFQIAEVARMYHIPLFMLQSIQGSTVWGSGVEQLLLWFLQSTMMEWIIRWEQEISRKLLTTAEMDEGVSVKFNLNSLMRGDMAARATFYKTLVESGIMVRNECRGLEDLDEIDGLNRPTIPSGWRFADEPDPVDPALDPEPKEEAVPA